MAEPTATRVPERAAHRPACRAPGAEVSDRREMMAAILGRPVGSGSVVESGPVVEGTAEMEQELT
jgi:hypothetical protein